MTEKTENVKPKATGKPCQVRAGGSTTTKPAEVKDNGTNPKVTTAPKTSTS